MKTEKTDNTKVQTVLAVDLDGTLLGSNNEVSDENLSAIKRLYERGVKTVLLTGRTFYEIPLSLRSFEFIDYFVYSNGAGIESSKKGMVYYYPIKKDLAREVFEILSSFETFIEFYSNGIPFVELQKYSRECFDYYKIDEGFIPEMFKSRKTVKNLEALLTDDAYKIEMFDVFFKSQEERKTCLKKLQKFKDLEITTSMENNLEIMNFGVNKGFGLKKLAEVAKYDMEKIIVIGDSKNDLTAFTTAKRKYAVSNAHEEIKALADKIICSNDENIMTYMEKELV